MIPAHSSGAACSSGTASGSTYAYSSRTRQNSAYPPSTSQPVNVGCRQRFSAPRRQNRQLPSVPPSQGTPTRSPGAEPGRTRPERVDHADHLVAGRHLRSLRRQVALGQVQVGTADAAGAHAHPDLAGPRLRHVPLDQPQRSAVDRSRLRHHPRPHGPSLGCRPDQIRDSERSARPVTAWSGGRGERAPRGSCAVPPRCSGPAATAPTTPRAPAGCPARSRARPG